MRWCMTELVAIVDRVAKTYRDGDTDRQVLAGVSLEVEPRRIVGIEGPSGSGKTTLLSIVAGLLPHDAGRVVVDGKEIDYRKPREVSRTRWQRIGFISQTYGLIEEESVFENVSLPLIFNRPRPSRQARRTKVERALRWAALDVNPRMKVSKLSRGERQRVALARALIQEPRLLVADEPTAALDSVTGAKIVAHLRLVADQGIGVLVATHDSSVTNICDVVYTLRDARLSLRSHDP